ncbi:MAG: flagellar biosynthesis protein FlhB [Lachnospiraceae bacterium]|nr:flagellar biosynthesis protein FlhB [Lachnospiraceae bacterium]
MAASRSSKEGALKRADYRGLSEGRNFLPYNLQFFAKEGPGGEKTEEPTQKKLDDARKEGQVAKSMELNNAISLITVFLLLRIMGTYIGQNFLDLFHYIYSVIPDYTVLTNGVITIHDYTVLLNTAIYKLAMSLLPVLAVSLVVGLVVNIAQVKWKPTRKPLAPKLNKLSPLKGMKRLFSKEKLMELFKSLLKIGLIAYVAYTTLADKLGFILLLRDFSLQGGISLVLDTVLDLGLRISLVYLVLGILDYLYNRRKFHEDMKMTKQEVKDEYKNSEGDPQIKGKIRQRMMEASRRRMMQSVPQADVVITNPTHFAVALKYDPDLADAPILTAKGQDFLAKKIRETAEESGVEIVENKPLARMLYANVDLDSIIPPELYQAVAEVLAFVYNLRDQKEQENSSPS